MKYAKLSLLFIFLFFFQLFSIYQQSSQLQLIALGLFGITLAATFVHSTKLKGRFHKRLFAGILFSIAGNYFLLHVGLDSNQQLSSFVVLLLCHICYTSAFYLDFRSAPELDKKGARMAIGIVFLFCIGFYFYFRPHLGAARVPFLAYAITISFMMMMAAFRHFRVNGPSFKLILMGAVLFLLSDVLATAYLFLGSSSQTLLLSTATFMAAQYLITIGGIERQLLRKD